MAVTLTSTGITFSDGTILDTAPSAGGISYQEFNNSGTWSHSGSGSPSVVLASASGGGGGVYCVNSNDSNNCTRSGTAGLGGRFVAEPLNTNADVSVTIGNGGSSSSTNFCGFYQYSCAYAQSGAQTNVGGLIAYGGNGSGGKGYDFVPEDGNPGTTNTHLPLAAPKSGGIWGAGGSISPNSTTRSGKKGGAFIIW